MGKPANPDKTNIDISEMGLILQGLNHLDQGISLFDADYKLRLFNKRFVSILNYPEGFVYNGMPFEELLRFNIEKGEYGPGDPDQQLHERLKHIKKMAPHQFLRERPDGTVLKIVGSPLPDGGFISTYEDVTTSEAAKHIIESREEQFKTYLEVSPVGALLVDIDGTIRFNNSRILDIFGYTQDEIKDITTEDFYYDKSQRIDFLKTLTKRDTPSNFRFLGKKKDGSSFPLLLTSQMISIQGMKRIVSWINDLTDIVKAERKIERLSEHNQLILSAAGAGIFGIDDNDIIQFINPAAARILGYKNKELKGKHLKQLLVNRDTLADLGSRNTLKGETEMVQKSGSVFPVKFTLSRMKNDQDVTGKVVVFDDISERIAAEQVLRQAMKDIEDSSQAKSHFLSTMSHELRTPLNAILGFAQILSSNQNQNLNDQQLTFIDHMFKAGEHLLQLVNEAIDIASIESGQVSLSMQSIDIYEVIEDCIKQSLDAAAENSITIRNHIPKGSGNFIIADYARLQQIIMHLISNAVKYNNENGSVDISCEFPEDSIRVLITDTGIGILPDEKENIFEPFNRLNSHSLGIEGTGLGLTLCKKLTQRMGGKIGFSSQVEKGSKFWIEFTKVDKNTPILPKKNSA